ncbi:MAG TPA: hypothetical protein VNQ57_10250 [Ureibacillus sp.]|nr:hypothetical protein [Ureibacillus sp.]
MNEFEPKKAVALEQYKEVKASRRHYSNLRFALFPVYFVVQFGLLQIAFKEDIKGLLFPELVMPICGILVTYVFWTIESRITLYYKDLEQIGNHLEEYLEFERKIMVNLSKQSILNNTKLSIKIVYGTFLLYWLAVLLKSIFL